MATSCHREGDYHQIRAATWTKKGPFPFGALPVYSPFISVSLRDRSDVSTACMDIGKLMMS
jgi:hypothetical protein